MKALTKLTRTKPVVHPPAASHGADHLPRQTKGSLRILVAEDHPVTGHLVTLMLEKMGHSVILATTGLELLACWEQGAFDLVLADINMPGIDGIEATRVIREREKDKGHRVPIVAMTANVMKEDQERFQNAGMDGYLPKPVSMVQLRELIESFLCRTLTDDDARPPQDIQET